MQRWRKRQEDLTLKLMALFKVYIRAFILVVEEE